MSRSRSRKHRRLMRRAHRRSAEELNAILEAEVDRIGPACAELWGRLLKDWMAAESAKTVPPEVADNALRIGFNLLLAAAALLTTPDPEGEATRMIGTADSCRRERNIRDLTIVVSQAIRDDMMEYRMRSQARDRQKAATGPETGGPGTALQHPVPRLPAGRPRGAAPGGEPAEDRPGDEQHQ